MGLSVWRETSKKLTVYRVCYTPIETLIIGFSAIFFYDSWEELELIGHFFQFTIHFHPSVLAIRSQR